MPDIQLEATTENPNPTKQAILDIKGGPFVPPPDAQGDVNLLCAHCKFALVQRLKSKAQIKSPPDGMVFKCPKCRKYSLLQN